MGDDIDTEAYDRVEVESQNRRPYDPKRPLTQSEQEREVIFKQIANMDGKVFVVEDRGGNLIAWSNNCGISSINHPVIYGSQIPVRPFRWYEAVVKYTRSTRHTNYGFIVDKFIEEISSPYQHRLCGNNIHLFDFVATFLDDYCISKDGNATTDDNGNVCLRTCDPFIERILVPKYLYENFYKERVRCELSFFKEGSLRTHWLVDKVHARLPPVSEVSAGGSLRYERPQNDIENCDEEDFRPPCSDDDDDDGDEMDFKSISAPNRHDNFSFMKGSKTSTANRNQPSRHSFFTPSTRFESGFPEYPSSVREPECDQRSQKRSSPTQESFRTPSVSSDCRQDNGRSGHSTPISNRPSSANSSKSEAIRHAFDCSGACVNDVIGFVAVETKSTMVVYLTTAGNGQRLDIKDRSCILEKSNCSEDIRLGDFIIMSVKKLKDRQRGCQWLVLPGFRKNALHLTNKTKRENVDILLETTINTLFLKKYNLGDGYEVHSTDLGYVRCNKIIYSEDKDNYRWDIEKFKNTDRQIVVWVQYQLNKNGNGIYEWNIRTIRGFLEDMKRQEMVKEKDEIEIEKEKAKAIAQARYGEDSEQLNTTFASTSSVYTRSSGVREPECNQRSQKRSSPTQESFRTPSVSSDCRQDNGRSGHSTPISNRPSSANSSKSEAIRHAFDCSGACVNDVIGFVAVETKSTMVVYLTTAGNGQRLDIKDRSCILEKSNCSEDIRLGDFIIMSVKKLKDRQRGCQWLVLPGFRKNALHLTNKTKRENVDILLETTINTLFLKKYNLGDGYEVHSTDLGYVRCNKIIYSEDKDNYRWDIEKFKNTDRQIVVWVQYQLNKNGNGIYEWNIRTIRGFLEDMKRQEMVKEKDEIEIEKEKAKAIAQARYGEDSEQLNTTFASTSSVYTRSSGLPPSDLPRMPSGSYSAGESSFSSYSHSSNAGEFESRSRFSTPRGNGGSPRDSQSGFEASYFSRAQRSAPLPQNSHSRNELAWVDDETGSVCLSKEAFCRIWYPKNRLMTKENDRTLYFALEAIRNRLQLDDDEVVSSSSDNLIANGKNNCNISQERKNFRPPSSRSSRYGTPFEEPYLRDKY